VGSIVQYSSNPFVDGGFAPYPLNHPRPHDRVTDENAPVTELDPTHPVFHYPNAIGDPIGRWIQERGAVLRAHVGTTYVPVLETHDPAASEPIGELKGGL